jgi:hypothetical protein
LVAGEAGRYTATVNPVKETMNLQSLQWTKNVRPAEGWAYNQFKATNLFKLAWRDDEANANRPERYDLILLRQHGYVTHLVKVLNRQAERDDDPNVFNIYRIVEVAWSIDFSNPPASARAEVIFGYPEVQNYMSGDAMRLEELPTFKEAWDSKGGLSAFQKHVQSSLTDVQDSIVTL